MANKYLKFKFSSVDNAHSFAESLDRTNTNFSSVSNVHKTAEIGFAFSDSNEKYVRNLAKSFGAVSVLRIKYDDMIKIIGFKLKLIYDRNFDQGSIYIDEKNSVMEVCAEDYLFANLLSEATQYGGSPA